MSKSINRSNRTHERLSRKHNDNANMHRDSTSKNFWSLVRRDYHDSVVRDQKRFGKILSKDEKKNLYRLAINDVVDYRKSVNEYYGFNRYIPKKYRK